MTKAHLLLIATALAAGIAAVQLSASERAGPKPQAASDRGPVRGLASAQPFVLDQAYTHTWRRENPQVSAGWLVVLEVDPAFVQPRQTAEPVLYAGSETVERINHGFASGRVVAIVPSAVDLARTPFYFGEPDLPERVDAAQIEREQALALARGAHAFTAAEIAAARARTPEDLHLARREDLEAHAGLLILEHSPEEHDLAHGLLVPPLK